MTIKLDVVGIGNAMVDAVIPSNKTEIEKHKINRDSMNLIDEDLKNNLHDQYKIKEMVGGGSLGNSMFGITSFGGNGSFIGKIKNDEIGIYLQKDMVREGLQFPLGFTSPDISTGCCTIFVEDDGTRTMCTFLGTAGKINEHDVDVNAIKSSEITFLEGYLWDEGDPKRAFDKAIQNSNKVAMSLSDLFCVERHKKYFLDLVKNKLDITFANEQEILSLTEAKKFDEVITFAKQIKKIIVITRGEKGSVAIYKNEVVECESQKNLKIIDLTGAGDLFAGGFLHGHINKLSMKESLEKGTEMSSKIIQKIGARLK